MAVSAQYVWGICITITLLPAKTQGASQKRGQKEGKGQRMGGAL